MARSWTEQGAEFRLEWGGRIWTLSPESTLPGLAADGLGPLLALDGLAECGRTDPEALSGKYLISVERIHGRVEATYMPPAWGGIRVRAAWSPFGHDALDLEVQLSAQSVGELRQVEVKVVSLWPEPDQSQRHPLARWVEPRDARAAGFSYDGREADLTGLTTLPPRAAAFQSPRLIPLESEAGAQYYVEMVHPQDVTRRIREGGRTMALAKTTRYGLFGYDLEKGVVLRGRLRAFWLPADSAKEQAFERFQEFVAEPPRLST